MSFRNFKKLFLTACARRWAYHCCTFRKSRLLCIAKITTSINQKNSSEGIWQGELTEEGGKRLQFTGENSACTNITDKTFDEKMLLNSSWCLNVSSITFILYNNPYLNNCFHFCK